MPESNWRTIKSICFLPGAGQRVHMKPGWERQSVDDCRLLLLISSGHGRLYFNRTGCNVRQGECFWVEPDVRLEAGSAGETDFQLYLIAFYTLHSNEDQIFAPNGAAFMKVDTLEEAAFAKAVMHMQELLLYQNSSEVTRQMLNQARFQELAMMVWLLAHSTERQRPDSRKAVERIVAYLDSHYDEPIDSDKLIEASGVGKRYFNQLFRERTGASLTEYITALRMNRAQQLLLETDAKVQDVARSVGYQDEFYFNRRFKQSFGMAPGMYARSRLKERKLFATQYLGHLLALGIRPVGATSNIMTHSFLRGLVTGIASIEQPLSIDSVSELQPDLIIGWETVDEERLSSVAPVIVMPYGERTAIDQFEQLAEMMDKRKEARQWISRYEAKALRLKRTLQGAVGAHETISIIEIWAEGIVVYGNRWGRGGYNIYNALELEAPPLVRQHLIDKEAYRFISLEQLPDYAGDHMFLSVYGEGGRLRAAAMRKSEIWSELPAVKRNCVYEVDISRFGAGDPISLSRQLDIQVRLLRSGGKRS
jgi:ABC-type Fe3+-hydroxamate transport system substrate-binding protein/AraC-like DNA-binding protein